MRDILPRRPTQRQGVEDVGSSANTAGVRDIDENRCAFEVAAYDQGAHVTYLGPDSSQILRSGTRRRDTSDNAADTRSRRNLRPGTKQLGPTLRESAAKGPRG